MAITWSQARDKIRGDLWRTPSGLPDDVLNRALHVAIQEIEAERKWLWLESLSESISILVATEKIDLPADCYAVSALSFQRNPGTQLEPLAMHPLVYIRALASQPSSSGYPAAFALNGNTAFLDRRVDVGSEFELIYTARTPEELSVAVAAGDTNKTLQQKEAIVLAGAAAHAATTFLRNQAEYARQRMAFENMMERLHNTEDNARSGQFGGTIIPDTDYQYAARGNY